jgi:hypothetical protein
VGWLRLLLLVCAVGCGGLSTAQRSRANDAVVFMDTDITDAAVWVNGRYIAPVASIRGGLALAPGQHRIEIRHDAYHTFYVEVSVGAKERKRVAVDLAPVIP